MPQWTLDLSKYAKKTQQKILDIKRSVAFQCYSSIMELTPVDTGRARGNWNISTGNIDNSADENLFMQNGLKYTIDDIKADNDQSIFISNNIEYIESLEYGHSKQAPQGMVRLTCSKMQELLNKAVQDNK